MESRFQSRSSFRLRHFSAHPRPAAGHAPPRLPVTRQPPARSARRPRSLRHGGHVPPLRSRAAPPVAAFALVSGGRPAAQSRLPSRQRAVGVSLLPVRGICTSAADFLSLFFCDGVCAAGFRVSVRTFALCHVEGGRGGQHRGTWRALRGARAGRALGRVPAGLAAPGAPCSPAGPALRGSSFVSQPRQ